MKTLLLAVVVLGLSVGTVRADYTLTASSGGANSLNVHPGDTFVLDLALTSNASDTHTSSVFDVRFSGAGLKYNGYTWKGSYAGSSFDNSQPGIVALPTIIGPATYGSAASPIDVHLENFAMSGYGTGNFVSLAMEVPSDFAASLPTSITISAMPDTFTGGAGDVVTSAGQSFTLNISSVPEPGSLGLLGVWAIGLLRRRRRA